MEANDVFVSSTFTTTQYVQYFAFPYPFPYDNNHMIIRMLMAATAQMYAFTLFTCVLISKLSASSFCFYFVSLWLLQGLWLITLYLMHFYVLMALTIPIIHCLGNRQSITTLWACTTRKVCQLFFNPLHYFQSSVFLLSLLQQKHCYGDTLVLLGKNKIKNKIRNVLLVAIILHRTEIYASISEILSGFYLKRSGGKKRKYCSECIVLAPWGLKLQ